MKFIIYIKHCDYIWLSNMFVSHVKSLVIIISQMGFFSRPNDCKYVINQKI
jgi:hypothetical protein